MKNSKTKTHNLYKIIFILVVFLGIGYAFLEAGLNINGDTTVAQPEFNTYVQSVSTTTGSTSGTPTIIGNDKKEVDFSTALTNDVNSFFEETSTLVNKGSKKSYLQSIDVKVYDSNNNEITLAAPYEYTLTHGDGTSITPGEELASAATTTYKLKFNYISGTDMNTVTDYPTYTFKITYNFTKNSFANDSWSTIATNVTADPSAYPLGATKTIEMDLDGDNTNETYMLRVVNNTTPAECSTTGFSQSACGFVVEFVNVLPARRMNPCDTWGTTVGDGNYGGWASSEMRAYINGIKYLEGTANEVDFASTGLYNYLPSELKSVIKPTVVVSSHGNQESTNFTSTDNLYFFSTKELWGKEASYPTINYDTAEAETRQLDYYKAIGVRTDNPSGAIKLDSSGTAGWWWLRTADFSESRYFYTVSGTGAHNSNLSYDSTTTGISPAFRIGLNN